VRAVKLLAKVVEGFFLRFSKGGAPIGLQGFD
jgi:hypothetical protein